MEVSIFQVTQWRPVFSYFDYFHKIIVQIWIESTEMAEKKD